MSANIETFGDLAAFVSHRELPWHRLGTTTDDVLTAESALELAHLNGWDVRKSPAYTVVDGKELAIKGKFAVVRTNPFTGEPEAFEKTTVGTQYDITQNEDHAEFLDGLAGGGAKFETAGSLDGGKRVFITLKAPETMLIGGVDAVDTYIMAVNTHDGSSSFQTVTTPVRAVCSNTVAAAFGAATRRFSKRHTAGGGGAVARAREALDMSFKYDALFEAEAEKMIQQSLTNRKFDAIVSKLYPIADDASDLVKGRVMETRGAIRSLYEASPTATEIRGTNWAGYNAVTEYLDYFVNVPGKVGEAESEARAQFNLDGKLDAKKELAFKLLTV